MCRGKYKPPPEPVKPPTPEPSPPPREPTPPPTPPPEEPPAEEPRPSSSKKGKKGEHTLTGTCKRLRLRIYLLNSVLRSSQLILKK